MTYPFMHFNNMYYLLFAALVVIFYGACIDYLSLFVEALLVIPHC